MRVVTAIPRRGPEGVEVGGVALDLATRVAAGGRC
jgi:hypothetical protein